ncbi:MAG: DUF2007 domain-containing protein [Bacteroidota bacterium]|nr:DUF2007 domain-containing protein [Bacteroidota bacterium]
MPYCPQCLTEYEAGVETCADCGVPLVEGNPLFCPKCEEPVAENDTFCDHCGVLLLEEDDEKRPECAVHPDRPAIGGCIVCGKPVCEECANEVEGKFFCDDDRHLDVHQDYLLVFRTSAIYEAEMVRANLESAGLDVQVFDQHGHIYFVDIGEMARVNVMVRKDQYDQAREIIASILSSPGTDEGEERGEGEEESGERP